MSWPTFWTSLIASLGGTGIVLLILTWLFKKWISVRIEESVKHEYAMRLEEHKAELQQQIDRSAKEVQTELQEIAGQKKTDRELFTRFLEVLPSSGSVEFIEKHHMGGTFEIDALKQVKAFFREWNTPECQFLDEELEKKRCTLHRNVGEYLGYVATNTWIVDCDGNRDFASVPKEWRDEQPNRYEKTIEELHNLADRVVKAHQDLVQTGRRKLTC